MEREILKNHGLILQGGRLEPQEGFRFVKAHRTEYPVRMMCRSLRVSPSSYYDWLDLPPSAFAVADSALLKWIKAHHEDSRDTYGDAQTP